MKNISENKLKNCTTKASHESISTIDFFTPDIKKILSGMEIFRSIVFCFCKFCYYAAKLFTRKVFVLNFKQNYLLEKFSF